MPKKKRLNWQALGFRTYAEYQQSTKKARMAHLFQECLQEADDCHKAAERQRHQEAESRLKYHEIRLKELRDPKQ